MYKKIESRIIFLFLLFVLFLFPLGSFAQSAETPKSARLLSLKLDSKLMNRQMPYRVLVPVGYDQDSGKENKYPVIYLLHGLTGHNNDWSDQTKLEEYTASSPYLIVMPEGDNGWYTDSETVEHQNYESYIIRELIPEIEKKFGVKKNRESRAIAGLSMGGFGALKFGVKYPEKFVLAGSFSGAIGAARIPLALVKNMQVVHDSVKVSFGETGSKNRKENDLFLLYKDLPGEKKKNLPFIYVDCGTEDFLIGDNRNFADLLFKEKISHEVRFLPGVHNWKFWDSQIQEFLELSGKFVK
jgi:S-formylglutathione hydrolase FrmB